MGDLFKSIGFDLSSSGSYMGGADALKEGGFFDTFDFLKEAPSTEESFLGGMDFANDYATSGPDLSYEPADLGGMEPYYSESPRASDYKKRESSLLAALGSSGKMPEDLVYEGGRLMSSSYGGPSGRGGGFRGVGDTLKAKEYLTADQYERLLQDRLKLALADFIRQSKINPLV